MLSYLMAGIGLGFVCAPGFFQSAYARMNKDTPWANMMEGRTGRISLRVLGSGLLGIALVFGDAMSAR